MDYKYIEQLLERYWNCETSVEEEQILRIFFQQKELPAHLRRYRSLFTYQEEAAGMKLVMILTSVCLRKLNVR